jgi:hypothetical protein
MRRRFIPMITRLEDRISLDGDQSLINQVDVNNQLDDLISQTTINMVGVAGPTLIGPSAISQVPLFPETTLSTDDNILSPPIL